MLRAPNPPVINNVAGSYALDPRTRSLVWTIPFINSSNTEGTLEYTIDSEDVNLFFPIRVSFRVLKRSVVGVDVLSVENLDTGAPVSYGKDVSCVVESYEVV